MNIGDLIPEVLGHDETGDLYTRERLKGEKIILYFYPKDNTSGCTAEACSLRDNWQALREKGYQVIGVSKDSAKSHIKFKTQHALPFPLLVDDAHTLQEAFGVWVEKKMYGKSYMGTQRSTFIINEEGRVTAKLEGKEVKTKDHALQLLELLS